MRKDNKKKKLEDFGVRVVKAQLEVAQTCLARGLGKLTKAIASNDEDAIHSRMEAAKSRVQEGLDALEQIMPNVVHVMRQCCDLRNQLVQEVRKLEPDSADELPFPEGWMGMSFKKKMNIE